MTSQRRVQTYVVDLILDGKAHAVEVRGRTVADARRAINVLRYGRVLGIRSPWPGEVTETLDNLAARGDNSRMNATATQESKMTNLTIGTTTYQVEGPTPRYGTFVLTGPRGAALMAIPAYVGDAETYRVIRMSRSGAVSELRVRGNAVRLTRVGDALVTGGVR